MVSFCEVPYCSVQDKPDLRVQEIGLETTIGQKGGSMDDQVITDIQISNRKI